MNYFKQLTLAFLLVFIGSSLSAQGLAVKGGLNLANVSFSSDGGEDLDTDSRTTFNLGLLADFPLGNVLSFRTGLVYQNRGFKSEMPIEFFGETLNTEINQKVSYLDIPLTIKGNFEMGNLGLYVFGGGYVGLGLSGEVETTTSAGGMSETETVDIEFEEGGLKRLDYGALIGLGVDINYIFVEVSYGLGLADIADDNNDDVSTKNRLLSLSVGYRFTE
jgi:hypothetical protein